MICLPLFVCLSSGLFVYLPTYWFLFAYHLSLAIVFVIRTFLIGHQTSSDNEPVALQRVLMVTGNAGLALIMEDDAD